jgi:gentisate 1,2-dioxygenase
VLHGTGRIEVGSGDQLRAFDVEPGDIVAIPSWAPRSVSADTQLDLFTTSDAPVLDALGLFRIETALGATA